MLLHLTLGTLLLPFIAVRMSEEDTTSDEDYVKVIKHGDQAIYMIGTAHISEQSCIDIRDLIDEIQPSVVMVELCDARLNRMINNKTGVC